MIRALEIPWGFQHPDVIYRKDLKVHIYKGTILPQELRRFAAQDFSYTRWQEDEINGMVIQPQKGAKTFTPRAHQAEAAKKIYKSYYTNWAGFLLADKTGLGKTLSAVAGLTLIAKKEGFNQKRKAKVLIVCPKDIIPQWRQTLQNYPSATEISRPLIMTYQSINKLLTAPPTARVVKKQRTKNRQTASKGEPIINWDFIIFDESQYLKNYGKSTMSIAAANIARLNIKYTRGRSPFVIYSTATPGSSPLHFSIMSNIIAPLIVDTPKSREVTPLNWGKFLEDNGFSVSKGKNGWNWVSTPTFNKNSKNPVERKAYEKALERDKKKQIQDAQRIGKSLKKPNAPFIMRSPTDIAGWPEQQIIPLPIELNSKQRPYYEEAWTTFRNWLNLTPAKKDPKAALVQMLRYRQKSSLLKVENMIETIVDLVESNNQVYISCDFLETIDRYIELLGKKGVKVCELTGRTTKENAKNRIDFQKGKYDVILTTRVAGISLHQGEILPDGTSASQNPRITIIHDVRQNNLDTEQSLGRAHRDGTNSIAYFPYIENSVDEKVIENFTNKTRNMKSMLGNSEEDSTMLERIFREAAARKTPPNRLS